MQRRYRDRQTKEEDIQINKDKVKEETELA